MPQRDVPAFTASCLILNVASATSTNSAHQSQKPRASCSSGNAKNELNPPQHRGLAKASLQNNIKGVIRVEEQHKGLKQVIQLQLGYRARETAPPVLLSSMGRLCGGGNFCFLFCTAVLSCPCILQVHSAETRPRALHSEQIKAHASPCAHVSRQRQPVSQRGRELQQGPCTAPTTAPACQTLKGGLKTRPNRAPLRCTDSPTQALSFVIHNILPAKKLWKQCI